MPGKSTVRCRTCKRELSRDAFDLLAKHNGESTDEIKRSCRECSALWRKETRDAAVQNAPFRFWSYVDRTGGKDACWEWQGARSPAGYGRITIRRADGRIALRTHRYAYELTYGPIADGMFICHRCDNPPCCNPAHLFAAPPAGNTADGRSKGRIVNKLNASDLVAIRREYEAGGTTYDKLAAKYGVAFGTIRDVVKGTIGAASNAVVHDGSSADA